MEKRDSKYLYGLTIVLAVAVVGLSIAYAALSTTLNAQFSTVTQNSASWNVAFDTTGSPITTSPLLYKGNSEGSSTDSITCGAATITANSVTVADTTLGKPGDFCRYTLSVKNTGTLAAKLSEISYTKPDSGCTTSGASMVCGDITYKLATNEAGTTLLATNSTIAANTGTQPVYLFISYTGTGVASSEVNLSNAKFTLVYAQN
jgi:hypothetical protein